MIFSHMQDNNLFIYLFYKEIFYNYFLKLCLIKNHFSLNKTVKVGI
jgi:hypothetical protein